MAYTDRNKMNLILAAWADEVYQWRETDERPQKLAKGRLQTNEGSLKKIRIENFKPNILSSKFDIF